MGHGKQRAQYPETPGNWRGRCWKGSNRRDRDLKEKPKIGNTPTIRWLCTHGPQRARYPDIRGNV